VLDVTQSGGKTHSWLVLPGHSGHRRAAALLHLLGRDFLDVRRERPGVPERVHQRAEAVFGVLWREPDGIRFRAFWAHDRASERRAFEQLVDFLHERLRADPAMYVYHYAFYEPAVLKRLMGLYGTREEQVDDLFRRLDSLAYDRRSASASSTQSTAGAGVFAGRAPRHLLLTGVGELSRSLYGVIVNGMETLGSEYGTCACGGDFVPRVVEVRISGGEPAAVLQDVPQAACTRCGTRVYKADVLERIEAVLRRSRLQAPGSPLRH
jgi:RNase_H superfamily